MSLRRVRCPQCGATAEYKATNPSRPFCSERCKLIDLGAWAEERYSIPGAATSADSEDRVSSAEGDGAAEDDMMKDATVRRLN